jgi:hypothetical protein
MIKSYEGLPFYDKLKYKVQAYFQTIWKEKAKEDVDQAEEWLANFSNPDPEEDEKEKTNMLYMLSKFMYFGNNELRQLLISLYRDLFKYPIVAKIRKANGDTVDSKFINSEFAKELGATRFLGVGNPSESGVHMLYYFRQECKLSREHFIDKSEIFNTTKVSEVLPDNTSRTFLKSELKDRTVKRYIFIDDFCGSGTQASGYLQEIVSNLRFESTEIEVSYLMLFGTQIGIDFVKSLGLFDSVEAVFIIDETFKAFSENSRYFKSNPDPCIDKDYSRSTALKYGQNLFNPALGYGNCELLLGLYHNTPDNSLPIFWSERNSWQPIFKRYNKIY